MIRLPKEIKDNILSHLDLSKTFYIVDDYVKKKSFDLYKHTWRWAVETNDLNIVKWVNTNTCFYYNSSVIDTATSRGNLDIVKWLYYNKKRESSSRSRYEYIKACASKGHPGIMQWLYHNAPEIIIPSVIELAATRGHSEVLEFLQNSKFSYGQVAINRAAKDGHFHILQWIYNNIYEDICYVNAMVFAIETTITIWLWENKNEKCKLSDSRVGCVYHNFSRFMPIQQLKNIKI